MQSLGRSSLVGISLSLLACSGTNIERLKTATGRAAQELSISDAEAKKSAVESKEGAAAEQDANASEMNPEMDSNTVAAEPVAIGGAYLTCAYPDATQQNASEMKLACELHGARGLAYASVDASFQKVDDGGKKYPLTVTDYDNVNSKWLITESSATLFYTKVEARLTINNAAPVVFPATIIAPVNLVINTKYWLFGEPNNQNNQERYAEFGNAFEVTNFEKQFGGNNGPLGRLNDNVATQVRPFLCRSVDAANSQKWLISTVTGQYSVYPTACPAGYRFSVPMSDAEVEEVKVLVDAQPANPDNKYYVWVALTDKNNPGTFQIILK